MLTLNHDSLTHTHCTHTHTQRRCYSLDYTPSGMQPFERKVLLSPAFERQQKQRQQQQQLIKYVCHHTYTHTHTTLLVVFGCCCFILHLTAFPAGGAAVQRGALFFWFLYSFSK